VEGLKSYCGQHLMVLMDPDDLTPTPIGHIRIFVIGLEEGMEGG